MAGMPRAACALAGVAMLSGAAVLAAGHPRGSASGASARTLSGFDVEGVREHVLATPGLAAHARLAERLAQATAAGKESLGQGQGQGRSLVIVANPEANISYTQTAFTMGTAGEGCTPADEAWQTNWAASFGDHFTITAPAGATFAAAHIVVQPNNDGLDGFQPTDLFGGFGFAVFGENLPSVPEARWFRSPFAAFYASMFPTFPQSDFNDLCVVGDYTLAVVQNIFPIPVSNSAAGDDVQAVSIVGGETYGAWFVLQNNRSHTADYGQYLHIPASVLQSCMRGLRIFNLDANFVRPGHYVIETSLLQQLGPFALTPVTDCADQNLTVVGIPCSQLPEGTDVRFGWADGETEECEHRDGWASEEFKCKTHFDGVTQYRMACEGTPNIVSPLFGGGLNRRMEDAPVTTSADGMAGLLFGSDFTGLGNTSPVLPFLNFRILANPYQEMEYVYVKCIGCKDTIFHWRVAGVNFMSSVGLDSAQPASAGAGAGAAPASLYGAEDGFHFCARYFHLSPAAEFAALRYATEQFAGNPEPSVFEGDNNGVVFLPIEGISAPAWIYQSCVQRLTFEGALHPGKFAVEFGGAYLRDELLIGVNPITIKLKVSNTNCENALVPYGDVGIGFEPCPIAERVTLACNTTSLTGGSIVIAPNFAIFAPPHTPILALEVTCPICQQYPDDSVSLIPHPLDSIGGMGPTETFHEDGLTVTWRYNVPLELPWAPEVYTNGPDRRRLSNGFYVPYAQICEVSAANGTFEHYLECEYDEYHHTLLCSHPATLLATEGEQPAFVYEACVRHLKLRLNIEDESGLLGLQQGLYDFPIRIFTGIIPFRRPHKIGCSLKDRRCNGPWWVDEADENGDYDNHVMGASNSNGDSSSGHDDTYEPRYDLYYAAEGYEPITSSLALHLLASLGLVHVSHYTYAYIAIDRECPIHTNVELIGDAADAFSGFDYLLRHKPQIMSIFNALPSATIYVPTDPLLYTMTQHTFPAFRSWLLNYYRLDRDEYWLKLHAVPGVVTADSIFASCAPVHRMLESDDAELQETARGLRGAAAASEAAGRELWACLPHTRWIGTFAPWEVLEVQVTEEGCYLVQTPPFFSPGHVDFVLTELHVTNGIVAPYTDTLTLRPAAAPEMRYPTRDFLEYVAWHPHLTIFNLLLKFTGLDKELHFRDVITVFIPTDDAFKGMSRDAFNWLFSPDNRDYARQVVLYHIFGAIPAYIYEAQFVDMTRIFGNISVSMLTGDPLVMTGTSHLTLWCQPEVLRDTRGHFVEREHDTFPPSFDNRDGGMIAGRRLSEGEDVTVEASWWGRPQPCRASTVFPWVDIETTNALIHKIDHVLFPRDVWVRIPTPYGPPPGNAQLDITAEHPFHSGAGAAVVTVAAALFAALAALMNLL